MARAAEYLKNRRRLAGLFTSASLKLRNVDFKRLNGRKLAGKVKVFLRMIRAYANGSYRALPWKNMLLILGSIIYFVTPIDMIPDFIPVSGLLDDFTVIVWVYNAVRVEVEEFINWEKSLIES